MTILQIALIVIVSVTGAVAVGEIFVAQIIDIYFEAKLEYTSKIIGGLGKVLTDAAKQRGGNEKD